MERDRPAQEVEIAALVKNRGYEITWWKVQLRTGTSGAYSCFFFKEVFEAFLLADLTSD